MTFLRFTKQKSIVGLVILGLMLLARYVATTASLPLRSALLREIEHAGYTQDGYKEAFLSVPIERRMRLCGGMLAIQLVTGVLTSYLGACVIVAIPPLRKKNKIEPPDAA